MAVIFSKNKLTDATIVNYSAVPKHYTSSVTTVNIA